MGEEEAQLLQLAEHGHRWLIWPFLPLVGGQGSTHPAPDRGQGSQGRGGCTEAAPESATSFPGTFSVFWAASLFTGLARARGLCAEDLQGGLRSRWWVGLFSF